MGILSFLTASRLKAEVTRQRDEIARMHQMLDLEVSQRQEAEKHVEEQIKAAQDLEKNQQKLRAQLEDKERALIEHKAQIAKELEEERKRLQEEVDKQIHDTDIKIETPARRAR